jgi:hypothetical protein
MKKKSNQQTQGEMSGKDPTEDLDSVGDSDPADDLDPFEINFLPQFREGRGPAEPFTNEFGVVIGDHDYESVNSPLQQWTADTEPEVMAGDHWVHPFKDIGFHTAENRDYFEQGIASQSGIFMHPDKDVAYPYNMERSGDEDKTKLGMDSEEDPEEDPSEDPNDDPGENPEEDPNGDFPNNPDPEILDQSRK